MKYRKKPVEVEARQYHRNLTISEVKELAQWCGGRFNLNGYTIEVVTLEGVMRASIGDYIIKGVQGEFYPCKPAIFTETYEEIE